MRDIIQKILEIAVNAPSGSNSQPWKFKVLGNRIDVYALPEKDHPILNYRNRGTWIAHGALLENVIISAAEFGYKTSYIVFPDKNNPNLTVRIELLKGEIQKDPLFPFIPVRATNRKKYERTPLSFDQKKSLTETVKEIGHGTLRLVEGKEEIQTLGEAGSMNEVVMLEDETLHKLFFNEIVWTKKQEERGGGLYLKTMEFKPPQVVALKIFRHWPVMKILNKIGIARAIARGNAKIYSSAAAMGAIIVGDKDEEFFHAGILLERIWLKASSMGLSLQLITGVLFFWQRIQAGLDKEFSKEHIELVREAYKKTAAVFGVQNELIALMFRIGKDGEPSARSFKSEPDIFYINE